MTTVCCLCHKIKSEEGWTKKIIPANQKLSHGYCPECYQKTIAIIETRVIPQERPAA